MKYARVNVEIALKLSKSPVKASACRLFYFLLGRMDDDLLIVASTDEVKQNLGFSRAVLARAIKELSSHGILKYAKGHYKLSNDFVSLTDE